MFHLILAIMVVAGVVGRGVDAPAAPAASDPFLQKPAEIGPTEFVETGRVHNGSAQFSDPEEGVSAGPITRVTVCHGDSRGYINGLYLRYGERMGSLLGFRGGGLAVTEWNVPAGEQIVRIKGEVAGDYLSRLQFITDRGSESPVFGGRQGGRQFVATDPNGQALRTIGVWANLKRHPSLARAINSITFKFGQPLRVSPSSRAARLELLERHAPRVWFHPKESFWPSSVEWSFHFLRRHWSSSNQRWWLIAKQPLKTPSQVLPYFHGADPNRQWTDVPLTLDEVPVYAFWHQVNDYTVDLFYFFYYPYNRGKEQLDTIFESHVGDWEHVTVRLTARRDGKGGVSLVPAADAAVMSFSLAYHSYDARYAWADVPKVQGSEHPIVYSAIGSHGSYLQPGSHEYDKAVTPLVDYADAGTAWDTWRKLECFDYDTKEGLGPTWNGTWPNWLRQDTKDKGVGNEDPASGPVTRWGNYRMGPVKAPVIGTYYRLVHGPTGPADKPCFRTPALD